MRLTESDNTHEPGSIPHDGEDHCQGEHMDAQQQAPGGNPPAQKPRIQVVPAQGSRMEELLDQHAAAKAAEAEAKARLKDLTSRIKAELTQAHPGIEVFDIAGSQHRAALTLTWVGTVRLDMGQFKRDHPRLYVEYAVFGGR